MKSITDILKSRNLLSIFLTAGFPTVDRTIEILTEIEDYNVKDVIALYEVTEYISSKF